LRISNVKVYGIDESIKASGYPMSTCAYSDGEITEQDWKRGRKLGNVKQGSGHDCYLKGCILQFDLTAPEYFWRQFDRYHFHDYVSSQSKMHCILKFDIEKMCNKYVDKRVIDVINEYIEAYNNYDTYQPMNAFNELIPKEYIFQSIISNCPMGLELTARITSNYLQEKSIYNQRRHHKLEEWQYYCDWLEKLPYFREMALNG
jgi:hypothetical protein